MKSMTLFGNVGTEDGGQRTEGGGKHYKRLSLLSASLVPLLLTLSFFAGGCPEPEPAKYTVTFDLDGGIGNTSTANQSITSGGKVTQPSTNPTKTSFVFAGWYKESSHSTAFDFATETITAKTTIYAKWAIPVSSITLDKTGTHATLIGKTTQLTASILPEDAPNKTLTWASSNTAVATIDENGLIKTLAKGIAVITATSMDGSNKKASITVNVGPYFYVPDDNFRAALKTQNTNWFSTIDGVDGLKIENAVVTGFYETIDVNNKSIDSLNGIEYFVALTSLNCSNSKLTTLDVSNNVALTSLNCSNNKLQTLDVSKNVALTTLNFSANLLSTLDVSNNVDLTTLNCNNNKLTTLDVSKNVALRSLWCHSNLLTTLDVSNNVALEQFDCYSNQLTSLDVSKNVALYQISCYSNLLTSLDVSNNVILRRISCSSNRLNTLDVSNNVALTQLYCNSNRLSILDVSKNVALTELWCHSNQLTSLDLRGMRSFTAFNSFRISTDGAGTNNSGLTSIKVHSSVTSTDATSILNAELIKVKAVATDVQIDSYTSSGNPSVTYASDVCDYNPSTGLRMATNPRVCKP